MKATANSAIRGTINALQIETAREERKNVQAIKNTINEESEPMHT